MTKENIEYEKIIDDYNNNDILFSIELSKARKFLMNGTIYATKYYIWSFLNNLLFPILILFLAITELGILSGIIYSIIAFIFYFDISGSASLNFKQARITFYVYIIIALLVKLFFKLNINLCFLISVMQLFSVYLFYNSIGKTFINNFLLNDKRIFFTLFNDVFFIKNSKKQP